MTRRALAQAMAMAQAMPMQQPQMQMMQVTCPPGVAPGSPIMIQGPGGQSFQVRERAPQLPLLGRSAAPLARAALRRWEGL